jgi:hypothetical protein
MASVQPDDLPLLTDIIGADGTAAEIPTLTEAIALEPVAAPLAVMADKPDADFEAHTIAQMASKLIWNAPAEPAVLPGDVKPERNISEAEMQQLVDHFETHLESVFTDKLNRHLEQLHHQAVKLAISELKSELPELLRKVLKN